MWDGNSLEKDSIYALSMHQESVELHFVYTSIVNMSAVAIVVN